MSASTRQTCAFFPWRLDVTCFLHQLSGQEDRTIETLSHTWRVRDLIRSVCVLWKRYSGTQTSESLNTHSFTIDVHSDRRFETRFGCDQWEIGQSSHFIRSYPKQQCRRRTGRITAASPQPIYGIASGWRWVVTLSLCIRHEDKDSVRRRRWPTRWRLWVGRRQRAWLWWYSSSQIGLFCGWYRGRTLGSRWYGVAWPGSRHQLFM